MEPGTPKFRVMKNGYDRFAVDDAVDRYVREIDSLKKQLDLTSRQIQSANEQLAVIRQRYQTLVSELTVKEKAADDIARLALKEANTIIETAAEQRGRDCERSADDRPDHPERPLAHRVGGDGDEGRYAGTAVLADGDAGSV